MGSAQAASSPELAPAASIKAPPGSGPERAAIGVNADEPNAFSPPPPPAAGGKGDAQAANAFSPPPAPAADLRGDAQATNAFSPPPAPAADPKGDAQATNAFSPPPAAPASPPTAVAVRTQTPLPAPPQMATGYVVPAGLRQETGYTVPQLTSILHDSIYPSQREWAAESLASMDWHSQPQIVDVLIDRAKQDPAPMVRAECLRSLGRMKAASAAAVEAAKALRSDPDDRVRQAAVEALAEMTQPAPAH
jgi:hypothetical protein